MLIKFKPQIILIFEWIKIILILNRFYRNKKIYKIFSDMQQF